MGKPAVAMSGMNSSPDREGSGAAPGFNPTEAMGAWMQAIAPYGILMTDADLRVRSWNDWLVGHSGRTAADALGQRLTDLYPEIAERHLDRHYARALAGEIIVLSTALHKYLLPFPSTAPQPVFQHMLQTVRIAPLLDGGTVVGTITLIEDVTQRELQANVLQRQQEIDRLLSAALAVLLQSGNPDGEIAGIFSTIVPVIKIDAYFSYRTDPDGQGLQLHAAAGISPRQRESIASLALSEPDQRILRSVSAPPDMNISDHVGILRRFGLRAVGSFPLAVGERLLGMVVFGSYQRDIIAPADLVILARIARYVAVAMDRTQREREILAASRAKDDFLAALSHELRTPLNPVLLVASDAAMNPDFSPEVRETFRGIEKNVMLEARLIDDLLDVTRIEHGKMALELQNVDLHQVLRDTLDTVRGEVEEQRLTLQVDLSAQSSTVSADSGRLQQVFWNVLKNAVKFTPRQGKIWVATENNPEGDEITLKVTDTGIGMDDRELDRVFDAFTQGDHAAGGRSHRFGGLGLGLAISRKLMDLHRGRIEATSEGKTRGTTFTLSLPLASPSQRVALATAISPLPAVLS